jgi:hypothetical protein
LDRYTIDFEPGTFGTAPNTKIYYTYIHVRRWIPALFPRIKPAVDVALATQVYLMPRLGMSGGIPLLPLFGCMALYGKDKAI